MDKTTSEEKRDPLNDPADFLKMGMELANSKAGAMVDAMVARVMNKHAGDPLWEAVAASILLHKVPGFHLRMLQDANRNAAYRKAIEIHAPGRIVLDIGTGSGLLAMIAARAGAARVIACEANPMIADRAKAVIAANGLADAITVIDRHSLKLDREADLYGGAEVVVSEVFATNLLSEGVLPSLFHARRHLAAPNAMFIPEYAAIRVALASFKEMGPLPSSVEGFDLSLFSPHFHHVDGVPSDDPHLALKSDPGTLFAFDFSGADAPAQTGRCDIELESHGGRVSGLAQWIELQFGRGIRYENAPAVDEMHHWWINTIGRDPHDTQRGDRFSVGGWYSEDKLECWYRAAGS